MAQAAIPILVGTGVQILGAEMGWDPRLTAIASIAAGGVGAGMTSGAFAGGTAAASQLATTGASSAIAPTASASFGAAGPGVATNAFNPATTGVLAGSQAGQSALAARMATNAGNTALMGGQGIISAHAGSPYNVNPTQSLVTPSYSPAGPGAGYYGSTPRPAVDAVAEVKSPFFDRTQYETVTHVDDNGNLVRSRVPVYGEDGKVMKGMSSADALGVSMLDTFMQYELAEARRPKPRPQRSGGGGGGSGGPMAPAYNGGGGSGQKQVTWGFGGGQNNGYQPQGLV